MIFTDQKIPSYALRTLLHACRTAALGGMKSRNTASQRTREKAQIPKVKTYLQHDHPGVIA